MVQSAHGFKFTPSHMLFYSEWSNELAGARGDVKKAIKSAFSFFC